MKGWVRAGMRVMRMPRMMEPVTVTETPDMPAAVSTATRTVPMYSIRWPLRKMYFHFVTRARTMLSRNPKIITQPGCAPSALTAITTIASLLGRTPWM
jgi:hypothetical protein